MNSLETAPRRISSIYCLIFGYIALILVLALPDGVVAQTAVRRAVELESFSAADLSLSLLRDNYDAWAEETSKKYSTEIAQRLSDQQRLIDDIFKREAALHQEVKTRLSAVVFSSPADQFSLRAALFLASRTQGRERLEALQRATVLSDLIEPGSEQALEITLMYMVELIASDDLAQASRLSSKVLTMAAQTKLRSSIHACFAKVVSGDVLFQQRNFSQAFEQYKLGRQCYSEDVSGNVPQGLYLDLRLAWSAFRLTRYSDVLVHLEDFTRASASLKFVANSLVLADLGVMLGVSLSEIEDPLPASNWLRASAQYPWVAMGLAKAVRYLSQRGNSGAALRWADAIEPYLIGSAATLEFYSSATDAAGVSGFLERQIDFKERGVIALQIGGHYARSMVKDLRLDRQRAEIVVAWSKEVISFRSAQLSQSMVANKALQYYRVAEALLSESIDLCLSVETLRLAHRTLATSLYQAYSEKIFERLRGCQLGQSTMQDLRLARLEMFQLFWKSNQRDLSSWRRFIDEVVDVLAYAPMHPEVRRISFDALNDSLEFGFHVDAEDLLRRLYASYIPKGEGSHFERASFISAIVRFLSVQQGRSSLENLAWLMQRDVAGALGVTDPSRRLLEASLAAFVIEQSVSLRREGRLLESGQRIFEAGLKMGQDSEFARDLLFLSARVYCSSGFQRECLETSTSISSSSVHAQSDKFYAQRWRGGVYAAQGRFVAAANAWVAAAELARASGRQELLEESLEDLARAGNIFAELKLWRESLIVKELMFGNGDALKRLSTAFQSVLGWSVLALRDGAFDSAELLSAGFTSLARDRRKELSAVTSTALSFGFVVEEYSKVRVRKLPAFQLEKGIVNFISGRQDLFTSESARETLPFGSFAVIRAIFGFWRDELEKEAELTMSGTSIADVRENTKRLGAIFKSLMRGCSLLAKQPQLFPHDKESCSDDLSSRFVGHNAKLISVLSNSAEASSPEVKSLYLMVQAQGDEFRRGALGSAARVSSQSEPSFSILEGRSPFLVGQEVLR